MSTVTLAQLLMPLNSSITNAFRFEKLASAQALRGVRLDIEKNRLSLTGETGRAIGKIARALNVQGYLLQDFIQVIIIDWSMKGPRRAKNKQFFHGVRQGFEEEEGK